jgi:hypothetical protein
MCGCSSQTKIQNWNIESVFSSSTLLMLQKLGFFFLIIIQLSPPLSSSGQSFWLLIQRSRVRFPTLSDFLRNRGSGTGYTQPREDN